ncbi:dihydrofolate reductase-like domain-containing protein [Aspergillus carlsbadensis]|nr:dihydrofolate reductase-like domain-containing protein [Aspergillus carlsbadensis]
MPPTTPLPLSVPITLIVATTPHPSPSQSGKTLLGIGLNGTLPWPRIKSDMSFFARVTARLPTHTAGHTGDSASARANALIMGRKTYDSVPLKLRPLGKRVSVVISRDVGGEVRERVGRELGEKREREAAAAKVKAEAESVSGQGEKKVEVEESKTDAFVSSGLEEALQTLDSAAERGDIGSVYVIGGAEIYGASLRLGLDGAASSGAGEGEKAAQRKVRIVMTDVEKVDGGVFECDTFFPVDGEELAGERWRKVRAEEVTEWVGEEVTGEWIEEGDVRVRMVGYERVDA